MHVIIVTINHHFITDTICNIYIFVEFFVEKFKGSMPLSLIALMNLVILLDNLLVIKGVSFKYFVVRDS